jgi:peptide-methionine (S)-S-oxide reductase
MEEVITVGGGCFWCIEAVFGELRGVLEVVSGYAGGDIKNPTYEQVCSGSTGHAEVTQVTFDPEVISLHDLLSIFFTLHDPTTPNQQGSDVGTQYRSIILYTTEEQQKVAEQVIAEIEGQAIWPDPVVTTIEPLEVFYPAEDYHQSYYAEHANQPYCQVVIAPKVSKLRKLYHDKLR